MIARRLSSWIAKRADIVTLGVQAVVVDDASRVLLIRHTYRPGWHFPGGGVERGEDVQLALSRELVEEAGIIITQPPRLFGIYANFEAFPGDHIALFVIKDWRQDSIPSPNQEIAEQGFFALDNLPDGTVRGALARLNEIFAGADFSEFW